MITLHEAIEPRTTSALRRGARAGSDDPFDPVWRAIMACDGVGREKTIALVLSAVEAAFPR